MATTRYALEEATALNPSLSQLEQAKLSVDNDPNATVPDTAILLSVLNRAEAFADSYARKLRTVPLTNPSDAYIGAILSVAKWYLYLRRSGPTPESVLEEYNSAKDWLEGVRSGEIDPLADESVLDDAADTDTEAELFGVNVF